MSRRAGRPARPGLFSFARRRVVPQTETTAPANANARALADAVAPAMEALEDRRLLSAPTFMIGAWGQPTSLFQRWKDRGINTMFHKPEPDANHPINTWTQEAVNKGLYMVRKPRPVLADDANQANLIGWLQPDEPDRHGNETFDVLQGRYDTWKRAAPNRKVYMTFSGGILQGLQNNDLQHFHDDGRRYTPAEYYPQASQYADIVGQDFYPVTGWNRPDWIDYSKPVTHYTPGTAADTLRGYSGNKPQYAIIETSDQNLSHMPNARGVNAAEFRGQVWDAIIHGATGIVYFSYHWNAGQFAGFDATPTEVHNEMITQHARINALDDVLVSPRNPAALSFSPTAPTQAKPLQATWRQHGGYDYFIVENMSSTPLTDVQFTLGRSTPFTMADFSTSWQSPDTVGSGGTVTDDFQPYQTMIYAIQSSTGHDAYQNIQAEEFNSTNGAVSYGTHIGDITNDDFVRYDNVDFGSGGAVSFLANLAVDAGHAGGRVEVWLDHRSLGTKIADMTIQSTGSYSNFQTQSVALSNPSAATGVHNVFLLFKGTNNTLANVDWFKFARNTVTPVTIQAETYNSTNGAVNYGTHIGDLTNDDFVRYDNVNFGSGGFTNFLVNLAVDAGHAGGRIEVWLDDRTFGTKIADLTIQSTGSYSNFQTQTVALLNAAAVTGVHNVFLKFKGTNNTLANVDWFRFA